MQIYANFLTIRVISSRGWWLGGRWRRWLINEDWNDVGDASAISGRVDGHDGVVEELIWPRNGNGGSLPGSGASGHRSQRRVYQDGGSRIVEGGTVRVAADFVESGRSAIEIAARCRPHQFRFSASVEDALNTQIRDPAWRVHIRTARWPFERRKTRSVDDAAERLARHRVAVRHETSTARTNFCKNSINWKFYVSASMTNGSCCYENL